MQGFPNNSCPKDICACKVFLSCALCTAHLADTLLNSTLFSHLHKNLEFRYLLYFGATLAHTFIRRCVVAVAYISRVAVWSWPQSRQRSSCPKTGIPNAQLLLCCYEKYSSYWRCSACFLCRRWLQGTRLSGGHLITGIYLCCKFVIQQEGDWSLHNCELVWWAFPSLL